MTANEPDSAPVSAEHVRKFIEWYQKRCDLAPIMQNLDWWNNALHTLSLGELRNGIRAYQRFTSRPALTPVEFWSLCKGRQDERSIEAFRKMRAAAQKTTGAS
jgi:hypothetical protein